LSYRASAAIWDYSVTYHQTQVNAPHLNPSQILDLPTPEGWEAELTLAGLFATDSHPSKC